MAKKIKYGIFRYYDKSIDKMFYDKFVVDTKGIVYTEEGSSHKGYYCPFSEQMMRDNISVMLNTSEVDKNLTHIFDGDIVAAQYNDEYFISEVMWHWSGWYLNIDGNTCIRLHKVQTVEILGNKYENPELLSKI